MSRARAEARDASRPDHEIIEEALSPYLLERLLDNTQRRANLTEEEATRLAAEELAGGSKKQTLRASRSGRAAPSS